jgi:hypothetical protein
MTTLNPDQLADLLDELVSQVPGATALVLEEWSPPGERDPSREEMDAAFEGLATTLEATVSSVEASWGEATYRGQADDGDFPGWSEALAIATWERGETVAFVALRADDPSVPMFIELGALSRDEVATLAIGRAP